MLSKINLAFSLHLKIIIIDFNSKKIYNLNRKSDDEGWKLLAI